MRKYAAVFAFFWGGGGIEDKAFIINKNMPLILCSYRENRSQTKSKSIKFRSIVIQCHLKEGENLRHHNYVLKPDKSGTKATGSRWCAGSARSLTR